MLVNHKPKQRRRLHPTRIYQENFPTYNHMYNKDLQINVTEGNIWLYRHCKKGKKSTNKKVWFGSIEFFINKEDITNISIIPKLEEMEIRITHDIQYGQYIFHTKDWESQFKK